MSQPSLFGDGDGHAGGVEDGAPGRASSPAAAAAVPAGAAPGAAPAGRDRRPDAPSGRRLVVEADGGSRGNPGQAGYGALVREPGGRVLAERGAYLGVCSNNVAEYTGLVEGLRAAATIDPGASVEVRMDSKLVVEQMSGRWKIKHEDMRRLAREARGAFDPSRVTYTWIPRAQNSAADRLANQVMDSRGEIRNDYDADDERAVAAAASPDRDAGGGDAASDPGAGGAVAPPAEVPSGGTGAASGDRAPARPRVPSGVPIRRADGEPVTLVLVRHGVTPLTEAARYSGGDRPGPGLSDDGREQVAAAGALLARLGNSLWLDLPRPSLVLASPMVRTRETGDVLARALGLPPPEADDAFAECRFGDWEGLTVEEMAERWPGQLRRWAVEDDVRPPGGGESVRDVGERVGARMRALAVERAGTTVVVAAHAVVIRAAVGVVAHMPSSAWNSVRVPPASVTILRLWPGTDGVGELTVVGCPSETGTP